MLAKTLKNVLGGLDNYEVVFEVVKDGETSSEESFSIDEIIIGNDFIVLRSFD